MTSKTINGQIYGTTTDMPKANVEFTVQGAMATLNYAYGDNYSNPVADGTVVTITARGRIFQGNSNGGMVMFDQSKPFKWMIRKNTGPGSGMDMAIDLGGVALPAGTYTAEVIINYEDAGIITDGHSPYGNGMVFLPFKVE